MQTTRMIPTVALTAIAFFLPTPKAWAQG